MSSNLNQTPDLASILKTLASLQNQQPGQESVQNYQSQPHPPQFMQQNPTHHISSYIPPPHSQYPPALPVPGQHELQAWQNQSRVNLGNPTPPPPERLVRVVDPATIIDWTSGLKCVMRIVAKHENMLGDIRKMIKVQHDNEQQWFNGRQALLQRQKEDLENQKIANETLKGIVGAAVAYTAPETFAHELRTYDLKIHKSQVQMYQDFSARLRRLGVPFFGTKGDLVRRATKEDALPGASTTSEGEPGKIDEADLLKLQQKMIVLLQDLCGD